MHVLCRSIPVAGQVWSVAWSPQNSQQLLLGLDKGRIAVADLRKSSTEALLLTSSATGSSRPMAPLHSMLALQPSQLAQLSNSSGMQWDAGAAPEAIVACAGMTVPSSCMAHSGPLVVLLRSSIKSLCWPSVDAAVVRLPVCQPG